MQMSHDAAARRDEHHRGHDGHGSNAVEDGAPEQGLDRVELDQSSATPMKVAPAIIP